MISHVVLHYNRPWLLETHVNLVRRFFPSVNQIIVADDGSDKDVLKYIKGLNVDNVYTNPDHLCEWENGSCSDTIRSSFALAKNKFISFSEDDFLPWPCGINDNSFYETGLFPDAKLNDCSDIMREACDLLFERACSIVQMGRDSSGWKGVPVNEKTFKTKSLMWYQMSHAKKKKFYYCNWPWIARKDLVQKINIPKRTSMWVLEPKIAKEFDAHLGNKDWSFCPDVRRFVHVGLPFSKKNLDFSFKTSKAEIRNKQAMNFLEREEVQLDFKDIKDFNSHIMKKWKQNHKSILVEDLMQIGLRQSFSKWLLEVLK